MALERNITDDDGFFLGEDKSLPFTIYQQATDQTESELLAAIAASTATAQNISGWTFSWMLKKKQTDPDAKAVLTKTSSDGIAITTASAGTGAVTVADTDTAALRADSYWHELKRTNDGFETVLIHGTCKLRQATHR